MMRGIGGKKSWCCLDILKLIALENAVGGQLSEGDVFTELHLSHCCDCCCYESPKNAAVLQCYVLLALATTWGRD